MKIAWIIKIAKDEQGQALVEFALIFTLLVILLFGIAEFGRGWYYANALSNGARAGVRYASLQPRTSTADEVRRYTFGQVTSASVEQSRLFVNVSAFRKNSGVGFAVTDTFEDISSGDAVMVIASYRMNAVTGHIVPTFSEDNTKTIVRKATMRYEGN